MPKLTWLPSTVELGEMTTYVFNEIFCLLGVADVEKDNEPGVPGARLLHNGIHSR